MVPATDPSSERATVREVAAVIYHFREALDSSLVMIVLTKSPVKPLPRLLLSDDKRAKWSQAA